MSKHKNCLSLLSGTILCSIIPTQAHSKPQPNIILINIDDLGWADLSYNGSKYYETPNIDNLHKLGVSFQVAYAAAANSAPSRASMLSGLYAPRHGVYTVNPATRGDAKDRNLIPAKNNKHLPDSIVTLPMVLQKAGYNTCNVGKWHVGKDPLKQGMNTNIAGNSAGHPKSYFSPYKNPNLTDGPAGECLTTRLGYEAANYIDTVSSNRPFFLYYAPYAVHTPLQAKDSLVAKYKRKQATPEHNNPSYAAMIENVDAAIGGIIKAATNRDNFENTVVVLTSDNGGVFDISKQTPLRAGKGSFYEGGIREPLIIYQKNVFQGGVEYRTPVSQLDLFPTFIELANIDYEGMLDGISLVKLLENGRDKALANRALYWHFPAYLEGGNEQTKDPIFRSRPVSVITHKGWKLIENYEDGTLELYHLTEDTSELSDIAQENPKKTAQLYKMLVEWKKLTRAALPTRM